MHVFSSSEHSTIHYRVFIAFLMWSFFNPALSQEIQPAWERTFENLAESIAERSDRQYDLTALYEQLMALADHPVYINEARIEELSQLIMLSSYQQDGLYRYIQEHGPILSIYEIPYIFGFDRATAELLKPFIALDHAEKDVDITPRSVLAQSRNQLYFRLQSVLESQAGYLGRTDSLMSQPDHSKYLGSPLKLYSRYDVSYQDKFQAGWTIEKDQGEPFFGKNQPYGFDFYSGYIKISHIWKIKNLIIGDYEPRFGQGLTIWSGPGYGKSAEVLLVEKRRNEIRKYASTNENQFFRGLATTFDFGAPELSVFISSKKIDAMVLEVDSISDQPRLVGTLQESGIHATLSQMANRRSLGELLYGFNLNYRKNRLHIGTSFLGYVYNIPIESGSQPYEYFEFSGRNGSKLGLDYKYVFRSGTLFGEISHNISGGWALLQGGVFMLREDVSVSLVYRNYSKDFQPIYSQAFGELSRPSNETGFYAGIELRPFRSWSFSCYTDIFSFPWLKFRVDAPSHGQEYFFQARFTPTDLVNMYWQLKSENKQINKTDGEGLPYLADLNKFRLRYHINYMPLPRLELRNRVEWTRYRHSSSTENGYLVYQDMLYSLSTVPVDISLRYAVFDMDSYDARIYAYENDVLYAFSIPAYYGQGTKAYVMIHSSMLKHLDIWVRLSRLTFRDRKVIGSGQTAIDGHHRTEIKIQMRVTF